MSIARFLCTAGALSLMTINPAHAETLGVAVSQALANHPSVDGAEAAVGAARDNKSAEFSGYFPQVNMNASAGRIYSDNSTSRGLSVTRGAGYSWLGQGGVTARQMIFDGLQTPAKVGAAAAGVKSAEMDLMSTRDNIAIQTVQAYISLLRAREGLMMLKGQQSSVSSYLERIQGMVNNGASDEAELQQARDVQAILDNYTADYEGQVRALEADYLALTGHLPEGALKRPDIKSEAIPKDIAAAIEQTLATHPQIQSAMYQADAAHENTRAETGTIYPDLSGELSWDKTDQRDLIGGESENKRALLRLNWDLETGGGQLARIRESKKQETQARSRVEETKRNAERAVRQAYAELQTAQKQLENQKTRVDLNTKLLDTYKSQFEAAKISLLQLMQSDNQLLITKLERLNADSRVLMARYNILAAMGQLQPALNMSLAQAETETKTK